MRRTLEGSAPQRQRRRYDGRHLLRQGSRLRPPAPHGLDGAATRPDAAGVRARPHPRPSRSAGRDAHHWRLERAFHADVRPIDGGAGRREYRSAEAVGSRGIMRGGGGASGSAVTPGFTASTPTSTSDSGKFSNTSTLFLRSPARCEEIALVSKVAYYT